eukprot:tig00021318_g20188.t1
MPKQEQLLALAHETLVRLEADPDPRSQARRIDDLRRVLLAVSPELRLAPFAQLIERDLAPAWKGFLAQHLEYHLRPCRVLFSVAGSEHRIHHHFLPPFPPAERAGLARSGPPDARLARLAYLHALANRAPPSWFERRQASDPNFAPALLAAVAERALHLVAAGNAADVGKNPALWAEWLSFADVFNLLVLQGWVSLSELLGALREAHGGRLPLPHPRADGLLYLFAQALPLEVIKAQLQNDLRSPEGGFTCALFESFRLPCPFDEKGPIPPPDDQALPVGLWSLAIAVHRVTLLTGRAGSSGAPPPPPPPHFPGAVRINSIIRERHLWALNYCIGSIRRLYDRMTQPAAPGQPAAPMDPSQMEPADRERIVVISHVMSQPVAQCLWNWAVHCGTDRARPRPFPSAFVASLSAHCRFRLLVEFMEPWLLLDSTAPAPAVPQGATPLPQGALPPALLETYARVLYTTAATVSRATRLAAVPRNLERLRFAPALLDLLTYRLFRFLRYQGTLGSAVADVSSAMQAAFPQNHSPFHSAEAFCLKAASVLDLPWPFPPVPHPPAAAAPASAFVSCPLGELYPRALLFALPRILSIASRAGAAGALPPGEPSPLAPAAEADCVAVIEALFNGPRPVTNGWAFAAAARAAGVPPGPLRDWAAKQSPLPKAPTVYIRDKITKDASRLRPLFVADSSAAGIMGGAPRPAAQADGVHLKQAFERDPEIRRLALILVFWFMLSGARNAVNYNAVKRALASSSPQEIEACEFSLIDFVLDESSLVVLPLSHALLQPQYGAALAQEGPAVLAAVNRASDVILAETAGVIGDLVWQHGLLRFESVASALAFRLPNSVNAALLLEQLVVRSPYLDQRVAAWCGGGGPKRCPWEDEEGVVKLAQHSAQFPDPYFLHSAPDAPPRGAVVSGQALAASAQQLIAASASGVGVPAGRGALRLVEVAALVLAAALEAGNERLLTMAADKYAGLFAHADAPAALALQLLHCHRVDSPLLAGPTAHPARFSLVALLDPGAASFTPLFRAHAAGAWDRAIAMQAPRPSPPPRPAPRPLTGPQGAPPPPLPALLHIPELLSSLVSHVPLVAGSGAPGDFGTPVRGASGLDLFHELPSHASRAMYGALLEVLAGPGTPQDVGQACLAAAVGLPEPPPGAPAGAGAPAGPLAHCSAAGWLLASLPGPYAAAFLQAARGALPQLRPAFAVLSGPRPASPPASRGPRPPARAPSPRRLPPQLLLATLHALLHYTAASPPPPLPPGLFAPLPPPAAAARLSALAAPVLLPLLEGLELASYPSPAALAWALRLASPFLPAEGPLPPSWARAVELLEGAAPACLAASGPASLERRAWDNFSYACSLLRRGAG